MLTSMEFPIVMQMWCQIKQVILQQKRKCSDLHILTPEFRIPYVR